MGRRPKNNPARPTVFVTDPIEVEKWNEAIESARKRIREMKRSICRFQSLRDQGMKFPSVKE